MSVEQLVMSAADMVKRPSTLLPVKYPADLNDFRWNRDIWGDYIPDLIGNEQVWWDVNKNFQIRQP